MSAMEIFARHNQHGEARMLAWRASVLHVRLIQILVVLALMSIYHPSWLNWTWACSTALTELLASFLVRREIAKPGDKLARLLSTSAWSFTNLIFCGSVVLLLGGGTLAGLSGAIFLSCAYNLNNAIMARGSWYQTIATIIPSALTLLAIPWIAVVVGLPISFRDALLLTVGSVFFVMLVGFLAAMLHKEGHTLEAALREAEAANVAKDRFLANMSHEIRTPLNGVVGIANALGQTTLSTPQREMVALINSSSLVLERLVSDLLDSAKLSSGRFSLETINFDLRAEIETSALLLRARALEKGLEFHLDFGPGTDVLVEGDPVRLGQIITNLVSNAIKFTAEGIVRVRVAKLPSNLELFVGDRLIIEVSDQGIGFDETAGARLFDAFAQADSSITRRFGGTGLGLSIARSLAEAMGGTLNAKSKSGEGSIFTLDIPFRSVSHQLFAEAPLVAIATDVARNHTNLRVLLAEDHLVNQRVVALLLEPLGVDLTIVDDGEKAVSAWRKSHFDVILMDMQMPVLDGLQAIRIIRKEEVGGERPRTPIAMLTANATPEHRMASQIAGADSYISKPITSAGLIAGFEAAVTHADRFTSGDSFDGELDVA